MATRAEKNLIPRLRPTPLTWLYVAFAVAVIVLTVWGVMLAAYP